ncbi:MAG: response regulator [Anaerolineae bacterium]|nr:response regulator [Anaerolineae bacterium]
MARILVIDDDLNLLQMVRLMLEREDHEVETARNAERGMVLAAADLPDVAIVDVMMPDISGYDMVRKLRENPKTARIPVIILTARSQPMDKQMALEAGANAFLSKPVTAQELNERVDAVIEAGVEFRVHTGLLTEPVPPPESEAAQAPPPPTGAPAGIDWRDSEPMAPPSPNHAPSRAPIGASDMPDHATIPTPAPFPSPVSTPAPAQQATPRTPGRIPIGAEDLTHAVDVAPAVIQALTVLSLRGGAGTTTLAVNLGLRLATRGERICIADFSTSSGHVHLHLRLSAQKNWGLLLNQGAMPDPRALNRLLATHQGSGLSVLPAPLLPPAHALTSAATQNVLRELNTTFQHVIVDARGLDSAVTGALKVSQTVIVLLTDDPPAVQSTGQLLLALRNLGVEDGRIRLVLNHVRATTDVPVDTIQRALKRPLNADLPYEPGHLNAIRRGVPVALANPDGAYCRALDMLVRTLPE